MSQAFASNGNDVVLVGIKGSINADPFDYYGVKKNFKLKLSSNSPPKLINIISRIITSFKNVNGADIIYSRWALITLLVSVTTKKKIIFEHHHLPNNWVNIIFEKYIIQSKKIIKHVFITEALKKDYIEKYNGLLNKNLLVLPDGAQSIETAQVGPSFKKSLECVYVGSFYPGKGIEVVMELAKRMPNNRFHVVGGNVKEVKKFKKINANENIVWYGYLPNGQAMEVLMKGDIALLPNQKEVLIGKNKTNIGKWTSPMKLFEYMSLGKAIVASDIPVIQEILIDKKNAVLASPDNIDHWIESIRLLEGDRDLLKFISINAKKDLEYKYSWTTRAKRVIEE
nr:glycosyltransferase family 4 protein [Shouchella xiaoxiensis]